MVLRRVGALSCARVVGLLYLILGFVFGAFVSLMAMGGTMFGDRPAGMMGMMFGAGAIVILPIFYGVLSFVMTFVMALLFNFVSGFTGGIEVDVS